MANDDGTSKTTETKRKKGLAREAGTVRPRPRGRVERAEPAGDDEAAESTRRVARGDDADAGRASADRASADRGGRRRTRVAADRPALFSDVNDFNRASGMAGIEAIAIAMDVASRVLRGAIDRALDEDYQEPGDIVRGFANEADKAGLDLVDEMRKVPRRVSHRFESSLRSPRADRGERARRAADAATPADSPENEEDAED
jgi:hypothetical protein